MERYKTLSLEKQIILVEYALNKDIQSYFVTSQAILLCHLEHHENWPEQKLAKYMVNNFLPLEIAKYIWQIYFQLFIKIPALTETWLIKSDPPEAENDIGIKPFLMTNIAESNKLHYMDETYKNYGKNRKLLFEFVGHTKPQLKTISHSTTLLLYHYYWLDIVRIWIDRYYYKYYYSTLYETIINLTHVQSICAELNEKEIPVNKDMDFLDFQVIFDQKHVYIRKNLFYKIENVMVRPETYNKRRDQWLFGNLFWFGDEHLKYVLRGKILNLITEVWTRDKMNYEEYYTVYLLQKRRRSALFIMSKLVKYGLDHVVKHCIFPYLEKTYLTCLLFNYELSDSLRNLINECI